MRVLVGCCGYAGLSLEGYAKAFPVIEIQSTFYRLPRRGTAEGWKAKAPELAFTVKAFQGVTHPVTSPTWKRAGGQRPKEAGERYGHLNPAKEVFECWRQTLDVCRLLGSPVCVVQLPPSFIKTPEHLRRIEEFFAVAEKGPRVAIEFRHASWYAEEERVARALKAVKATHIVDPLLRPPIYIAGFAYYRLHGLGPRLNYRYQYTNEDLQRLKRRVRENDQEVEYVMFNNLSMREDGKRFMTLMVG